VSTFGPNSRRQRVARSFSTSNWRNFCSLPRSGHDSVEPRRSGSGGGRASKSSSAVRDHHGQHVGRDVDERVLPGVEQRLEGRRHVVDAVVGREDLEVLRPDPLVAAIRGHAG